MPPDAVRPVVVPPEDVDPPKDVEPPAFVNDPASPSQRDPADYTATGVKVGVLDMGFDNEPPLLHRVAVAAQLQGTIRPQDAVAGTHGSQVSRLIGGRDIGDEFPTGAASNFLLYQANLAKSLTGDVLGDSLNALADRGVKIVNNSWSISAAPENHLPNGANVMANSVLAQAFFPRMREAVLARGQLLIWANGNEGTDQPFLFAGAPYIDPALERGWITVVQLQDGHLVASSNACGLAANWCLGAQAPAGLSGTSYSAPLVTAAAAQVSQIFPWMDNSALRQTILSTADDLGTRDRTGWGELNATRALGGPARFDRRLTRGGDFEAKFDAQTSHFLNDIAGDAGLIKSGTGTLALWGENTYSGTTRVDGGTLALYGGLSAPVAVGPGGLFMGEGARVAASVSNSGTVQVNGAGLRVGGDYTAVSSGAVLATQLGSAMTVGGKARLNNSRLIALKPAGTYVVKSVENVLKAGAVEGVFGQVDGETGLLYSVSPRYSAGRVDLAVTRRNVAATTQSLYAQQPARLAAGEAVETAFQAADRAVADRSGGAGVQVAGVSDEFIAAAAQLQSVTSAAELGETLDSISGQIHASAQALSFQQANGVNRILSDRIDALALPGQTDGLWASAAGGRGKLAERGFATATTHHYGGMVGMDRRVGERSAIGLALSFGQSDASFDAHGGRSRNQTAGVSVYGRHGAETGAYVAGRLGYGFVDADTKRDVWLDQTRHRIEASHKDQMASVYAETGYSWAHESGARTTPFAAVSYDRLRRGALNESGHAFGLTAARAFYHQTAALLGLRLTSAPVQWIGGTSQVGAYAAYRHGERGDLDFDASFVGAPDRSFRVKGIGLPRHAAVAGVSWVNRGDNNWSWLANVDVQIGQHGTTQHIVSVGGRYTFD